MFKAGFLIDARTMGTCRSHMAGAHFDALSAMRKSIAEGDDELAGLRATIAYRLGLTVHELDHNRAVTVEVR